MITKNIFNFRREWLERLTFCSEFYENRWIGFVDKAFIYISQCLTMEAAILLILSRDQNRKLFFTGICLCFALENSSSKLHYIKGMHIGHLLTLFCILTAVILIFDIVRL